MPGQQAEEFPDSDLQLETEGEQEELEEEELEEEGEEETQEAPADASTSPAQPSNASTRSITLPDVYTPERLARAEELGIGKEVLQFFGGIIKEEVSRSEQAMLASQATYELGLSKTSPEYARVVGPRIREQMARLTPEQRADPKSVTVAQSMAALSEALETGEDFITVASRHAELARGGKEQRPASRQPSTPPSARVPTATVSSAPTRAARGPVTDRAQGITALAELYGISEKEARRMYDDPEISG